MIAEGSSKLASVPSGGAGGAAPAAGGAAAGGAVEEKEEEKKEEGMFRKTYLRLKTIADSLCREGRVRRGYGIRSLRLSSQCTVRHIRCSLSADTSGQGFGKGLYGLCLIFACHGSQGTELEFADLLMRDGQLFMLDSAIQTCLFQIRFHGDFPAYDGSVKIISEVHAQLLMQGLPVELHVTLRNRKPFLMDLGSCRTNVLFQESKKY